MKVQKMRFNHHRLSVLFHTHAKKKTVPPAVRRPSACRHCRRWPRVRPPRPGLPTGSAPAHAAGPIPPQAPRHAARRLRRRGKKLGAGRTTQWQPTGGTVGGRRPFVDRAVRDTLRPRPSLTRSLLTHQAPPRPRFALRPCRLPRPVPANGTPQDAPPAAPSSARTAAAGGLD